MRWLDSIINSMDMNLSKLCVIVCYSQQGCSLVCYSQQGCKELNMTEQQNHKTINPSIHMIRRFTVSMYPLVTEKAILFQYVKTIFSINLLNSHRN